MSADPPLLQALRLGRRLSPDFALQEINLTVPAAAIVGIVGPSAGGKSTLVRCLVGLDPPDLGEVLVEGRALSAMTTNELRRPRRLIQLVPQDAGGSLSPRFTVAQAVVEPLLVQKIPHPHDDRVAAALTRAGLDPSLGPRPVTALSGGQRRRVAIARALVLEPRVLVLDESFTGLDLPLQARLARTLLGLRDSASMALVIVAHDLSAVAALADRIVVVDRGRVVEDAAAAELWTGERHQVTASLVAAHRRLRQEVWTCTGC